MKPPRELDWILDPSLPKDMIYIADINEMRKILLRDKDKRLPSTRMTI